jgi:hypothetical protein
MALDLSSALIGGLLAFLAGMIVLTVIVSIGLYILMSFAYMAIAKKAKLKAPGLAWIPGVGPLIIAFQTSKMHWWPWLLLIGCFIPFVNFVFSLAFTVFVIIWHWKMFETIRKPGWWSILYLIPIVGIIMVCVAAWSKE